MNKKQWKIHFNPSINAMAIVWKYGQQWKKFVHYFAIMHQHNIDYQFFLCNKSTSGGQIEREQRANHSAARWKATSKNLVGKNNWIARVFLILFWVRESEKGKVFTCVDRSIPLCSTCSAKSISLAFSSKKHKTCCIRHNKLRRGRERDELKMSKIIIAEIRDRRKVANT